MTSSKVSDEISFRFKLPSEGLALRAVAVVDGVPELRFGASPKVPTITEEDVAAALRLAMENKRPEFYYYGFPFNHPFYGRQYKHYKPQWLRETSLGDLLAESDWEMKCLYVGAKSDKSKSSFWSWPKASQLEGLATSFDFRTDQPGGSIIMSCESVKVHESVNEMVFIDEPKMRIDSQTSTVYSKYITAIYDNVAYHDEPRFLKMREVPKLILAAEWLKKKGVKINREWMKCTTKPRRATSQAIEVRGPTMTKDNIRQILTPLLPRNSRTEQNGVLGSFLVDTRVKEKDDVGKESLQFEITETISFEHMTPLKRTTVVRASMNDYDMLYSGMDPKIPVCINEAGEPVIPNVKSWSELFSETVPWPRTWLVPYISLSGGVSTRKIPVAACKNPSGEAAKVKTPRSESCSAKVQEGPYIKRGADLSVRAEKGKGKISTKPSREIIPQPDHVNRPSEDVSVHTWKAEINRSLTKSGVTPHYGWQDHGSGSGAMFDEDGRHNIQQRAITAVVEETTGKSGKGPRRGFLSIPLPPTASTSTPQSESTPQPVSATQPVSASQPIGATLPSPSSSTVSGDSGIASLSNEPCVMNPAMVNQPPELTDADDNSSDGSKDSGCNSPPNEPMSSESSNNSSDEMDG